MNLPPCCWSHGEADGLRRTLRRGKSGEVQLPRVDVLPVVDIWKDFPAVLGFSSQKGLRWYRCSRELTGHETTRVVI